MMDASGFKLGPNDLHPHGKCGRCGRILVRARALPDVELPAFLARHASRGLCKPCHATRIKVAREDRPMPPLSPRLKALRLQAATVAADIVDFPDMPACPPSRVEPFLGMATRGEPRGDAANAAARDSWIAARRRRLDRSRGRALRSALSTGWEAL